METLHNLLPPLETRCPRCEGMGHSEEQGESDFGCSKCGGAGYLPTEDGKRVLNLMRHNFRRLFNQTEEGS